MDGLVSGVTTLTSQPQLSQIQQRVQSLCGWGRFVKLSLCFEVSNVMYVCLSVCLFVRLIYVIHSKE